eukprot:1561421-Rhodomonas_salina.1
MVLWLDQHIERSVIMLLLLAHGRAGSERVAEHTPRTHAKHDSAAAPLCVGHDGGRPHCGAPHTDAACLPTRHHPRIQPVPPHSRQPPPLTPLRHPHRRLSARTPP